MASASMSMGSWLMISKRPPHRGRESIHRLFRGVMRTCVWRFSEQVTRRLSRPLLVCLLVALPVLAEEAPLPPLQVNARAVPDKVKLGESFAVEVTLTHVKDQRYDLKLFTETENFDVGETQRK